jgi:shikimate kinase
VTSATTRPILVLVGAPGAGKTTVGRLAAELLGVAFRDTDSDVERVAGKTVTDIFIDDGEAAFRALERSAVEIALAEHEGVLALGGGAVLDGATRSALAAHRVVWLEVGLADATRRIGLARDRPVLALNPRATLARLLAERRAHYEAVADTRINTDGREPADVAADVAAAVAVGER